MISKHSLLPILIGHSSYRKGDMGVLGYPIGIILDNGQALTSDDLSNLLMFTTVKISFASVTECLSRCR